MIDDDELLAWLDGELDGSDAARVAAAVAANPALTARADAHRRVTQRLSAGFAPLIGSPAPHSATVVSLAQARSARRRPANDWRRYAAIAATLVVGVLTGMQFGGGVGDTQDALVASNELSHALETQLSGQAGAIRVSLSFRDRKGSYCRSFSGRALAGIACRDDETWRLRFAAAAQGATGAYRTASGGGAALAEAVEAMIDGAPLDAKQEARARAADWQ